MFTGIIEEIGTIKNVKYGAASIILTIAAKKVTQNTNLGDSIAVNGVCLTVTKISGDSFDADIMAETLRHSSMQGIKKGDMVNLERAMSANGRFGGHIVAGHVDGVGKIAELKKEDNAVWVTIEAKPEILKYIVYKGSVALDGISLTVANVDNKSFSVSVIPHTKQETTLLNKDVDSPVNIECDVIGKYVEKMLLLENEDEEQENYQGSNLNEDFLKQNGFL